jgi:ATP-dependent exoDNAse (exonuclease V) beta subunit
LELTVIDTHGLTADRSQRSRGTRFGSLVHQLLEHLDYADPQPALEPLALGLGRELGASDEERAHAVASVRRALAHSFFERVRSAAQRGALYRELPIVMCGADGTVFDGVIDLAFREPAAHGEQLWVIDFKTDVELTNLEHYRTQLGMYASAATQALGLPASIVLLRV